MSTQLTRIIHLLEIHSSIYINLSKITQWTLAALGFMGPVHLRVISEICLSNQEAFTVGQLKAKLTPGKRHNEVNGDEA
jgi:pimeloyl-CoA synthetase